MIGLGLSLTSCLSEAALAIAITSGGGYAGSVYTASESGGQWYADGVAIVGATALTWTMTVGYEGAAISYRKAGRVSNIIEMWMPGDLGASLVAWFDAAYAASLTLSGSSVTNWASRVGGVNATQATGSYQPTRNAAGLGGLGSITFDGVNDCMAVAAALSQTDQYASAVVKTTDSKTSASWFACPGLIGSEQPTATTDWGWGLSSGKPIYGAGTADIKTSGAASVNTGNALQMAMSRVAASGLVSHYLNGSANGSGTNSTGSRTASGNVMLGCMATYASPPSTAFLAAEIGEILFANAVPSDANRQKIEGYQAWRWGLQAALPAGHPYQNAAPRMQ